MPLQLERWHDEPTVTDIDVLALARGPVLDVGCGPGRHAMALATQGVPVLGIDAAPSAVALARARGVPVLHRSVFDRIPCAGRWATILLLDGNIGIGGDAVALLRRAWSLLASDGAVLVEVDPPGEPTEVVTVRVERDGHTSCWFPWARVAADEIVRIGDSAGFVAVGPWEAGGRWFAQLVP